MITDFREQCRYDMAEGMHEPTRQRCFNQGSDARLAGDPIEACPFPPGDPAWAHWCEGWRHVDQHWAVDNGYPKPKRKLRQ
jgi:ribosome modulation factor